jgi:hypothetical protein
MQFRLFYIGIWSLWTPHRYFLPKSFFFKCHPFELGASKSFMVYDSMCFWNLEIIAVKEEKTFKSLSWAYDLLSQQELKKIHSLLIFVVGKYLQYKGYDIILKYKRLLISDENLIFRNNFSRKIFALLMWYFNVYLNLFWKSNMNCLVAFT